MTTEQENERLLYLPEAIADRFRYENEQGGEPVFDHWFTATVRGWLLEMSERDYQQWLKHVKRENML